MKIVGTYWFTGINFNIGIVIGENEIGEKKAYIKTVSGFYEDVDTRDVLEYGTPMSVGILEEIRDLLKRGGE